MGFSSMAHGSFLVPGIPEGTTFRTFFGWAAMIECANARMDTRGYLQFKKWNFSEDDKPEFEDFVNSPTFSTSDIQITGIQVKNGEKTYLSGEKGYVLELENRLVAEESLQTVAGWLGDALNNVTFRSMEGELADNPLIEFGDVVCSIDRRDNKYVTPITDVSYSCGGRTTIKTQADDPIRGSRYQSAAGKVLIEAREIVEKERTEREKALEKMSQELAAGSGMYATYEDQPDGSTITYLHDKPTLSESQNVIKLTSEAVGVSNDGGKTYPYGFVLTGTMITRLLYAEGINADYIDTGALTVRDKDRNVIFQADVANGSVIISADSVRIGDRNVTQAMQEIENSVASVRNMTMQLTNQYVSIPVDESGAYASFPADATTQAVVMYGSKDITADCAFSYTKSSGVTGTWNASTRTYKVTALSADTGWVDIKATYLQTLSVTQRFSLSKLYQGARGLQGLQGEKGEQGVAGKDGTNGKTTYFHIKYSAVANPTTASQMTETPSTYIGTYVDYTATDSADPAKYKWSRFQGSQGAKGDQGIAGVNGTNGETSYLHIAYANSSDGKTDFSVSNSAGKAYIGQYTDFVKADSSDYTKYKWTKIKGNDGADGRSYILDTSSTIIKTVADGFHSPLYVKFSAYYRDGTKTSRTAYAGRFKIEETADGSSWTTVYTSISDETSVTRSIDYLLADNDGAAITDDDGKIIIAAPRQILGMRCTLYAAGGTTTVIDVERIPVVKSVESLSQEEIFNILTNDGAAKGLFMDGNQLYVSFTYARGGMLALGGANNGNGYLYIYDADNNRIGSWTKDGINVTKGTFSGELKAATGTFKGTVTAGNITGSTISGSSFETSNTAGTAKIEIAKATQKFYSNAAFDTYAGEIHPNTNKTLISYTDASGEEIMSEEEVSGLDINANYLTRMIVHGTELLRLRQDRAFIKKFLELTGGLSTKGSGSFSGSLSVGGTETVNGKLTGAKNFEFDGSGLINTIKGSLIVYGDVSQNVTESSNTAADTSVALAYSPAYASPTLSDVGTGKTGSDGTCYVSIDATLVQAASETAEYVVFLQAEGEGSLYIAEKQSDYFVVRGTPNLAFAWKIEAAKTGTETVRYAEPSLQEEVSDDNIEELEKVATTELPNTEELEDIASQELAVYDAEMEEIENENIESVSGD